MISENASKYGLEISNIEHSGKGIVININNEICLDDITVSRSHALVSKSEKNTDNTNLIETTGLEFYSNPYLEDNRLINALNDL